MSRGSVYYLPRPASAADLELMGRIDRLHLEHPFMGTRMLRDQLARDGLQAKGLGCHATRASSAEHLAQSLRDALLADRPTLIEVRQDSPWLNLA